MGLVAGGALSVSVRTVLVLAVVCLFSVFGVVVVGVLVGGTVVGVLLCIARVCHCGSNAGGEAMKCLTLTILGRRLGGLEGGCQMQHAVGGLQER